VNDGYFPASPQEMISPVILVAMLTGESKPVAKQVGAKVIGGSINSEGSITVVVRKTGKESFLSQVIELVRQAQESKSKTQDLAWATGYNIVAIPLAAGVLYKFGILLTPAAGAVLMASSTVIVAINARFLKIIK
jgi:P-type Cu2+ transporter